MARLQDESTTPRRAVVFTDNDGATLDLCERLRDHGFELELRPIADIEHPLPTDTSLVVVDTSGDHEAALAGIQRRVTVGSAAHRHELEATVAARTAELERANEELQVSEQRYRSVIETAPLAMVVWDTRCRILSWNRAAERTFGFSEQEVIGRPFFDVFIPADARPQVEQVVEALLRGELPSHSINHNSHRSGKTLLCEWNNAILRDRDGAIAGVVSMGADITERRQLRERLRHAEKMEAIGQLAGGVAHDFNNQLVAMMGYADLIRRMSSEPTTHDHASRILQATRRSADLVSKLLTFARRAPHETKPVDLVELITEVAELLRHSIDRRIVVQQLSSEPVLCTLGDAALLHSALLNLGLNARDAMPDGGTLSFECRTRPLTADDGPRFSAELAPGPYVEIRVRDTGVGIPANTLEHIFEPFFTTKTDGTGMGLAAVYGAIRTHRGGICVDSTPDRGTTFTLVLPRGGDVTATEQASSPAPAPTRRARILVVDDEPLIRELLINVLGDMGHEVVVYGDGRRALEHYRDHWDEIDLAILDVVMPEIDGIHLYHDLRAINSGVRALLSSGYAVDDRVRALTEAGVLGLLRKPYGVEEVEQRVRAALSGRPSWGD